jgi:SAM-dependent methyltransferase/uncharacterized protein YbaR (Trm112 family)
MYKGFPRSLIPLICCQRDGNALALTSLDESPFLQHASLVCEQCGMHYPIREGFLELVAGQDPIDPINVQEIDARDREASHYEAHLPQIQNESELGTTLPHVPRGGMTVDYGCGTGRVTLHLVQRSAGLVAIDFSRESLKVFAAKIDRDTPVGLVLADATQTRLARNAFDVAISTMVIEHIPTEERRRKFYSLVHESLKARGKFVFTVYHYPLFAQWRGVSREGFHASNIFFHRFTGDEIRRELADVLDIVEIRPFYACVSLVRRIWHAKVWLSRMMDQVPGVKEMGWFMLVIAQRNAADVP